MSDSSTSDGSQKTTIKGGVKGTTIAADITSTDVDSNRQAMDVCLRGSSSVSVSNFPATQVVSGTVAVSNFPASQAVTGSFFQATQPVSIAATVGVTGTFFQSTQPVSIAASVAVTGPATDAQLRATPLPISGTVTANAGTGTFATSLATLPALVAGSAIVGKFGIDQTTPGTTNLVAITNVDVALSTRLKPADTLAGVTTVAAVTAITNQLPTGSNKIGTVDIATAAATAKGTQGANGVPTQDLKDSGRNQTNYFMAAQIVSTATDALMSLTGYKSGAAVAATTTPAVVTAAKTYRLTSITMTYVTIVTTPGAVRFTLRANTGGVVAITSPAVNAWTVGEPTGVAPVAGKFYTITLPLPDGMEFAAGTGIGLSMVGIGATGTAAIVGYGIASITGFEY